MNPWNIPRDLFLGIFREFKFRGNEPSEYTEESSFPRKFPMKIPRKFRRNFRGKFRGLSPSVYSEELSDELVVLGVSSEIWFLGIPSENSEGFPRKIEFPKSYF
ncbi:hypothetical protein F2Q69_00053121 [Brassica cretica]|uniref:Uncharacterized protein n=1 Tax=Brassica cretica TaxID=69181 RepID=A0A8S9MY89_BRACR|nr:hypothetical protein F2Q69_00053121 [Brassica cretica]